MIVVGDDDLGTFLAEFTGVDRSDTLTGSSDNGHFVL
jgi:hypothetical protein